MHSNNIQQFFFFFHFSETLLSLFSFKFFVMNYFYIRTIIIFFFIKVLSLFLCTLKGYLLNKDRLNFCTYLTALFAQHNLAALSFQWFSAILSRFIAYMEHFWYSLLLKRWKLIFKLTSAIFTSCLHKYYNKFFFLIN